MDSKHAKELEELTRLQEKIKQTKKIKAPEDFLQQVKVKIAQEINWNEKIINIWDRFHIRAFFQTAAAVAVVLLMFNFVKDFKGGAFFI